MKVELSNKASKDLRKHKSYVRKLKKPDGHKYQDYEIDNINKALTDRITDKIGSKNEHENSIFPDEYDYGHSNYKMHIDTKSHYIVFYKILKDDNGEKYVSIEKCTHSTELRKELKKKKINVLDDANPRLLLDYITIEKEDKVKDDDLSDKEREEYKEREAELKDRIAAKNNKKSKSDNDDDDEETEATDPKTGKKVKLVPAPPGPRGGPRVKVNGKGKIRYRSEFESKISLIPITEYLQNSKMKHLTTYIQENL